MAIHNLGAKLVAAGTAAALFGFAAAALAGDTTGIPAAPAPYQRGDQVWTTDQLPAPASSATEASDAAAAAALPSASVTPVRPYQAGDQVWTTDASVPSPAQPNANGCQRVPASGYIGTTVYAATTDEYATSWSWSASSSGEPFIWYIKHTDGSNQVYGSSSGYGDSVGVPGTVYYWEVQNKGSDPQAWNVCYSG
ncbi:MAG TPA: hypothetical protein VFA05_11015 [Gaiellaceae bacterium]|nr:hypothetical protein [Gaiellaceae bacterium]